MKKLKYLEFVQVAAIYAVVCFSSLYEYAKDNAGPLKPGVQTVEGTVKAVVGPVYEKFQDLPFQLLKFVDRKVRLVHRLRLNLISFPVTELCGLHFAGGRVIQRVGASRALPREAGVEQSSLRGFGSSASRLGGRGSEHHGERVLEIRADGGGGLLQVRAGGRAVRGFGLALAESTPAGSSGDPNRGPHGGLLG